MANYGITAVLRRVVLSGSAGTGPYNFSFPVLTSADIAVYKDTTLLALTDDYTVSINASNGTGTVTLGSAANSNNTITIVGSRTIERSSDFVTQGVLLASTLNSELDSQVIFTQQISEEAGRAIKAPVTDPTDISMTLPVKATRLGKVLAFNSSTGNPEMGPTVSDVQTVSAASADIALLANIQDGTTATNAITTLAPKATEIGRIGTSAAATSLGLLGTTDAVSDMNALAAIVSNLNTVAGVSSNVTTVAGISSNVTSVAGNTTNINTVAGNNSNINTVAGNNSNVTTVAGISSNVTTVAGISSNVTTVAGKDTEIGRIGTSAAATSLGLLGTSDAVSDMNALAAIVSNINTVAGNSSNINTVAGVSSNVTTVAGISSNVTSVAGNATNINTVAGNNSNISTVAGVSTNVTTLSGSAVVSDMETCADNISSINLTASKINNGTIDAINDYGTVAGSLSSSTDYGSIAA